MVAPILLESYIIFSLCISRFTVGFILAYPTILTAGLTNNSTDLQASIDDTSTITASYSITGLFGFILLPKCMQSYGRKMINVIVNLIYVVGSVVIALASSVPGLIAGRSIQGVGLCGLFLGTVISSEYTHPKRRGPLIIFQTIALLSGILLCHVLGFTLTWRELSWFGTIPAATGAISTLFWPESPPWLAYVGRYDDCIKNFELLRGKDMESRRELKELITAQQQLQKRRNNDDNIFVRTANTLRCIEFLKPLVIMTLLIILAQACGVYYMLAYIIEIMQNLTEDPSQVYYYIIGLDLLKILAVVISTVVMSLLKRRTILFYIGSLSCFFLCLVCICDYLTYSEIISIRWLSPALLLLYCGICQIGIFDLYAVYSGEIFPLEYRGMGSSAIGIVYSLFGVVTLKYTTFMLIRLKVYGTFGLYLIVALGCMIILYFILPETKDETLQRIEMNFIDIEFMEGDECDREMITKANENIEKPPHSIGDRLL